MIMKSMQENQREIYTYYVQWFDERRGQWVTQTDDLNGGRYTTEALAMTVGLTECFQYAAEGKPNTYRIVARTVAERVTTISEYTKPKNK